MTTLARVTAFKTVKAHFRLRRGECLETGIHRLARQQIDAASRGLQKKENPSGSIHEARKALKKLRAILKLVGPGLSGRRYRKEKQVFRDAAKLLAPLRDAQVHLNTLNTLIAKGALVPQDFSAVRGELEAAVARLSRRAPDPKHRVVELLRLARGRVRRWSLGDLEERNLLTEIRRAYRKGRKALRASQQDPSAEALHAWRKSVKELWYHLRITRNFLPKEAASWIAEIQEIGEVAGDANDLTVLRDALSAHEPNAKIARLVEEIDKRLPGLQRSALERGAHFYAEKARDFSRRLEER